MHPAASLVPALMLAASVPAAPLPESFRHGLGQWRIEAEVPARVLAKDGVLDIDSAEGITLWLKRTLASPVRIDFDVLAVARGGPNDAVSDVNAFWMAHENDGAPPRPRGGAFAEYDTLRTYYVGIGGNRNTTTRMRRYIGRPGERPLLPAHDLQGPEALLRPNRWTQITLIADGPRIAVLRDGRELFALADAAPYTKGWFGLRTTKSHLQVRNLRITSPRHAR